MKDSLGDQVQDVRRSERLTESPCCLVNASGSMSTTMQRVLRMNTPEFEMQKMILEINPKAPLIKRLSELVPNPQPPLYQRLHRTVARERNDHGWSCTPMATKWQPAFKASCWNWLATNRRPCCKSLRHSVIHLSVIPIPAQSPYRHMLAAVVLEERRYTYSLLCYTLDSRSATEVQPSGACR